MKTIISGIFDKHLTEAVVKFKSASKPMALTGAGISVGSGIPDFRSVDGLWAIYSPEEYATLEVFMQNPQKAWELYRAMGKIILGKKPNPAHKALADLESAGFLNNLITQNVDNLHQLAGHKELFEIHGDHQHLQCLQCGKTMKVKEEHYQSKNIPQCESCFFPLKPNVVLFGESVRHLDEIHSLISRCDLLMVIGTSAQVYPASDLPMMVKQKGGLIYEFNKDLTSLSSDESWQPGVTDYFFKGDVTMDLPGFVAESLKKTP